MNTTVTSDNQSMNNIYMELAMPGFDYTAEYPLTKTTMEVFNEISLDWKTQIYNNVARSFGGKLVNYISTASEDTRLPEQAVDEFAKVVIEEHSNDPRVAATVMKTAIEEHVTMMSAMAMHQSIKESGNMQELTKVVEQEIEKINPGEACAPELAEMLSNIPSVDDEVPKAEQFVDPKHAHRKQKKKGAQRRSNIDMGNRRVKQIMGATILGMLGKVQRDTQDANKKALLKELPAADIIEMATGKKLPDYQANLINQFQAKADPAAPIVTKMQIDLV